MATDTFSKNPKKGGPALQEAPDTDHSSAERALPHAIGPEKSILSSMFQDPQEYVAAAVENKLTDQHFYHPAHGALYTILLEFFEINAPIELVSFTQTLMDRNLLASVGGQLLSRRSIPMHLRMRTLRIT